MALAVGSRRSGARAAGPKRAAAPERAPLAEIAVFDDDEALFDAAAREVARIAADAVARRGRFAIALAGGSTPRGVYERLARRSHERPKSPRVPWRHVRAFFGDERAVPPDDSESNFRMARESLLSRVPIPRRAIHRVHGELGAAHAAIVYEATIRAELGTSAARGTPRFDLILLGVGGDGHTASLFPRRAPRPPDRRVAAPSVSPIAPRDRVTLTIRAINAARAVLFLAAGPQKADVVARVLAPPLNVAPRADGGVTWRARIFPRASLPASLVAPRAGRLLWFLDRASAARLFRAR